MSFQNSDLFALIIIVTLSILILAIAIPVVIIKYFRKKKLHHEEKVQMNVHFEEEVLKTYANAQEQTMQLIAADLHDNIGPLLSLTFSTLSSINIEETEKAENKIANSLNLITESMGGIRGLVKLLHAEQTIEIGLGKAIEQFLDFLRETGNYNLSIKNQILNIRNSHSKKDHSILLLVQEILNNIIKHAKATHIDINIHRTKTTLYINVKENGIGFNYKESTNEKTGKGLDSIYHRIEMVTGKIKIDSKPSQGTSIRIAIPYP